MEEEITTSGFTEIDENNLIQQEITGQAEQTAVDVNQLNFNDELDANDPPPHIDKTARILFIYSLLWSLAILIASPLGAILSGEKWNIWVNYYYILITPSKLVTDYFNIGGLGSALLNTAICGLFCNFMIAVTKTKMTPTILAAYFLVIAHCFYGLNIINCLPPFLGILVYSLVRRQKFRDNLHIAMFATSLAPFVSEFLFRYTINDYTFGSVHITASGVILAVVFGLFSGFIVPALIPGTTRMHRGYNLYKAGIAIGMLGLFVFAFLYRNFDLGSPDVVSRENLIYAQNGYSYSAFMNTFFIAIFVLTFIYGFAINGKSFKGYGSLLKDSGHISDFPEEYGLGATFINIGLYGLMIVLYVNLISLFTEGVGWTGPTAGVTIAAITFTACGQHPKNVFPVIVGYIVHYLFTYTVCQIIDISLSWSLSSQSYINGLAFATGLCPLAGKYGFKIGIIAGFVCAIICASTSAMHGGFVLYNGGFSAGLTAMIIVPILDFYKVKQINLN